MLKFVFKYTSLHRGEVLYCLPQTCLSTDQSADMSRNQHPSQRKPVYLLYCDRGCIVWCSLAHTKETFVKIEKYRKTLFPFTSGSIITHLLCTRRSRWSTGRRVGSSLRKTASPRRYLRSQRSTYMQHTQQNIQVSKVVL